MVKELALTATLLASAALTAAQQSAPVDTSRSSVTVHVYKTGLFSGLAHNHVIKAPVASGTLDTQGRTVSLTFKAADLQLMDTEGSESEHREIESTMKGPKVLDAERFPTISFQSKRVDAVGQDKYQVVGELVLHGVSREIALPVALSSGVYKGAVSLKQTEFGITPVKVAGGTVKVKDEIEITFEIVTR